MISEGPCDWSNGCSFDCILDQINTYKKPFWRAKAPCVSQTNTHVNIYSNQNVFNISVYLQKNRYGS